MPKITLTLANRVEMAADSLRNIRRSQEALAQDEERALDQLALAESEVLGKGPGWEEVELSGLIPEGKNPYYTPAKKTYTAAERAAEAGIGKEAKMEHPEDAPTPEETPLEPPEDEGEDDKPKAKKGKEK